MRPPPFVSRATLIVAFQLASTERPSSPARLWLTSRHTFFTCPINLVQLVSQRCRCCAGALMRLIPLRPPMPAPASPPVAWAPWTLIVPEARRRPKNPDLWRSRQLSSSSREQRATPAAPRASRRTPSRSRRAGPGPPRSPTPARFSRRRWDRVIRSAMVSPQATPPAPARAPARG